MSAFVVEDRTINHVVTWMEFYDNGRPWLRGKLAELGYDVIMDSWEPVARRMFILNIQAVNARYGDGEAEKFRPLDYCHEHKLVGPHQVYKSLQCWLYQCAEGNVPDDALYRLMQEVGVTLAHEIISKQPEYETATWE